MQELIASIQAHGVLQPLLVRKNDAGHELIAGHRRLSAAKAAGLATVPVIVRECTDRQMLELALVENLQREDINAIERAKAYHQLKDDFGLDQEAISAAVGKSRASVANTMRLLALPMRVQNYLAEEKLSEGHARALMGLGDSEDIIRAADQVIKRGLSVRATENLVKRTSGKHAFDSTAKVPQKDPNLADLESRLSMQLGTRVTISLPRAKSGKGFVHVEFYGLEDLERVCGELLN